jgi:CRP-like cAMP-binding protein
MTSLENSIRELGILKKYKKDEHLFNAQDEADGFYYIESGEVRVFKMDEEGREIEIVRLEPGDFFGEAIVFVSSTYPSFATATKDSRVRYFPKRKILQQMEIDPNFSKFFINLLARKCVTLTKRIEALELQTVRKRLIQYLLSNCTGERDCLIELRTKKVELAKILGTVSETLSRNLRQMQDEGLIEVKGNKILVKNCPKLKEELSFQP